MKHAIIIAHPGAHSFIGTLATAYREAVEKKGDVTVVRDLYRERFDPCLKEYEFPWAEGFRPGEDVVLERKLIGDAGTFALFYPLWLNAPPAILKGYLERVFGMGFAYQRGKGGNEPMLQGRKLISFSSSGAPMDWVVRTGAWSAVRALFDSHFAAVCGMEVLEHAHFGGIVPGIRADVVERHAKEVRERARAIP